MPRSTESTSSESLMPEDVLQELNEKMSADVRKDQWSKLKPGTYELVGQITDLTKMHAGNQEFSEASQGARNRVSEAFNEFSNGTLTPEQFYDQLSSCYQELQEIEI